jgi:hypothetical protein
MHVVGSWSKDERLTAGSTQTSCQQASAPAPHGCRIRADIAAYGDQLRPPNTRLAVSLPAQRGEGGGSGGSGASSRLGINRSGRGAGAASGTAAAAAAAAASSTAAKSRALAAAAAAHRSTSDPQAEVRRDKGGVPSGQPGARSTSVDAQQRQGAGVGSAARTASSASTGSSTSARAAGGRVAGRLRGTAAGVSHASSSGSGSPPAVSPPAAVAAGAVMAEDGAALHRHEAHVPAASGAASTRLSRPSLNCSL